jgi:hypothetical protein
MEFVQRAAEDSPIVKRMLENARGAEEIERVLNYMDKVDAFRKTGMVTITTLPYEGPDLSPGADRENCMKRAGKKSQRPTTPIPGSGGRRIVPLVHGDTLEYG